MERSGVRIIIRNAEVTPAKAAILMAASTTFLSQLIAHNVPYTIEEVWFDEEGNIIRAEDRTHA